MTDDAELIKPAAEEDKVPENPLKIKQRIPKLEMHNTTQHNVTKHQHMTENLDKA